MDQSIDFPLFEGTGVDPASLSFADRRIFATGAAIVYPAGLGLVLRGRVRVSRADGAPLNAIPAGGMFGASTLHAGNRKPGTCLAADGATEVLFLPETEFTTLLLQNRRLLENYLGFVAGRICFLNGRLNTFASQRCEDKLLRHVAQNGGSVTAASMTELSAALSMGRASLYRAIDTLTAEGRLRRDGDKLILL